MKITILLSVLVLVLCQINGILGQTAGQSCSSGPAYSGICDSGNVCDMKIRECIKIGSKKYGEKCTDSRECASNWCNVVSNRCM